MKQLGFQPELEVWTVWTRSGRSGHGLRCLEPGQKFRKFNSDHFPFFKNLYRTFGSRVSLPWLEIGSGRSGNGVRCLEPGQKFRIFNSDHFTFLKNFNPTSGSRVYFFAQKNTSRRGEGGPFTYCKKIPTFFIMEKQIFSKKTFKERYSLVNILKIYSTWSKSCCHRIRRSFWRAMQPLP